MSDPLLKRIKLATAIKAVVVGSAIGVAAACCTVKFGVLHDGPQTQKISKITLSESVQVQLNDMSRVELFVGGIHVGTILLDGEAGIFVGVDATQSAYVLDQLIELLNLFQRAQEEPEPEFYY